METDKVIQLLKLVAQYDIRDEIWWNQGLEFMVVCNDVFWWGTADAEGITEDSFSDLESALIDGGDVWGPILYCARMRKMRPQGAMYKHIDEDLWPLFDACGPKREIGVGNPDKGSEMKNE